MATDKNPKPRKDDTPTKKASLPRRNKTGKRPHSIQRLRDQRAAAQRTGRIGVSSRITPNIAVAPGLLQPSPRQNSKDSIRRDIKNPGAGPASVSDMQARQRGNAPSIRKRKTSNYVKGRKSK